MRTFCLFLLTPLIAGAQAQPPVLTGVLLERDAYVPAGQLAVRAPDNEVYRFAFDRNTQVDRGDQLLDVGHLNPGEKVEVATQAVPGSRICYARTIRAAAVISGAVPLRMLTDTRIRAAERPPSMGTLTFSGVVARLNGQRLVLHTRAGEQNILIRRDTHYVEDGGTVGAGELKPNMRVFVRAGPNVYEQVEAYQVIWGKILEPGGH